MRPQPYIGITGFTTQRQICASVYAVPNISEQLVMVGVLVSNKTLRGEANKWPERYPKAENLRTIFTGSRNLLNLLHFNTNEPESLLRDMCLAQDLAGPYCDGFQLNLAWPNKRVLEDYKFETNFRRKIIVFQCGADAIKKAGNSSLVLAEKVAEYGNLIDYVLVDPSGGLGREFDLKFAEDCLFELRRITPNVGSGIAGGLHAQNVSDMLLGLLDIGFEFSIDAEGKLRDKDDLLDTDAARAYLTAAHSLFSKYRKAA